VSHRSTDTTTTSSTDSLIDSTGSPPTATDTQTDRTGSPAGSGSTDPPPDHRSAIDEPNPDHDVRLRNAHDVTHTVRVTLTRESGETVYETRHEIEPGAERIVYSLAEATPAGIERFTATATLGDATESVGIETNTCYGDAYVEVTDNGSLSLLLDLLSAGTVCRV
jgi:hypothetical protein